MVKAKWNCYLKHFTQIFKRMTADEKQGKNPESKANKS